VSFFHFVFFFSTTEKRKQILTFFFSLSSHFNHPTPQPRRSLSNVTKQCDAEALKVRGWAPRSPEVVVDVEWPAFDDALLPALPDDAGIQGDGSSEPRVFETLTAPMCLGEAARRLLVRLSDAGGWFYDDSERGGGGVVGMNGGDGGDEEGGRRKTSAPPLWRVANSLDAVAVARVAGDCSPDARFAAEELADAFTRENDGGEKPFSPSPSPSPSSSPTRSSPARSSPSPTAAAAAARRNFLRFLLNNRDARVQCRDACLALLRRSARLTAAGLAGVLLHREETTTTNAAASSFLAPSSPLPTSPPSSSVAVSQNQPQRRRTIVAVEGAMLRRGGLFADELRRALAETLEASSSSSPLPLPPLVVSLTAPDGGSALGVAALAAAADNAARAMGQQDLGAATTTGEFLRFPPRAAPK